MRLSRILAALSVVLIAVLACNVPGAPSPNNSPNLPGSATAQTIGLEQPAVTDAPLSSPTQQEADSAAVVKVTSPTNCRSGPGTAYNVIFIMNPGPSLPITGKDTRDNYWIVSNPIGGECWLWGQFAIVTGDTSNLPEYPPPPVPTARPTKTPKPTKTAETASPAPTTPAPMAPADLTKLTQTRTCAGDVRGSTPIWVEDVALTWQDNANNEDGYRVFKNNGALPPLPAGATQYQIKLRYDQGTGGPLFDTFGVEAFNGVGNSARASIDVPRCP